MRTNVRIANNRSSDKVGCCFGLIINPVAGMGGPLGLKGSDGPDFPDGAARLGGKAMAGARAERALVQLLPLRERLCLLCAPGPMGADLASQMGFHIQIVEQDRTLQEQVEAGKNRSSADDTRSYAQLMANSGVALLLFAGGDGTARDILDGAPGQRLLGIPAGVKMHSAVFATTPEAAGRVARTIAEGRARHGGWRQAEIMDLDEVQIRQDHVAARLYGYAETPVERTAMQNCKTPSRANDDAALEALADRLVREMPEGQLYVLGCGETMRRIKRRLGSDGTLLGVDVAMNGRLIATDVDEARLLRLISETPANIITSVTGGQGFVFGRGNQQISADVLRRVGRDRITIVTGAGKLIALDPACLRVDTGDPAVDLMLAGYMRVHTAPGQTMMMRIAA